MTQYLLLIHRNAKRKPTPDDWEKFVTAAKASGLLRGGSELGDRLLVGDTQSVQPTSHIGGYMRFDAEEKSKLLELLQIHPVVAGGGTIELCEMPRS